MNSAFYIGKSGLKAYSDSMNVTAHNIANSGTTGYKATNSDFRELVFNQMDQNINKQLDENSKIRTGHGVKIQSDSLQFSQGVLTPSDSQLDFAIASGNSLFAVNRDNSVQYTRNGSFDISVEGNNAYLVTSDGGYVLDRNYNKINIPYVNGKLDTAVIKSKLGIFSFDNPYGLFRVDGQSFAPTDVSGTAAVATPSQYELRQGMLENSNINLAKEMSDVIVTQKAYQFSAKVVQTADEIEDIVNNLRR